MFTTKMTMNWLNQPYNLFYNSCYSDSLQPMTSYSDSLQPRHE